MMATLINPTRRIPTTKMITTKHTTINKTTSTNKIPGIIQSISSNSIPVGATMTNRGCWLDNLMNPADAR